MTTTVVKEKVAVEERRTFTTQFSEASRVRTRITEEAFKIGLPCNFEELGGLKDQTYGVTVKGSQAKVTKFVEWYDSSIKDLVEPRGFLGLAIKNYL